ncbi:Uncharacterised protein [Mycobacterium tuberculosis]|nr:Uncharacterised protein [Mycobacterium tuberculosis]
MGVPRTVVFSAAVRMKCLTGVTQRIISSVARGMRSRSSRSSANWSGLSMSACMPPEMVELVVSCPAVATMR